MLLTTYPKMVHVTQTFDGRLLLSPMNIVEQHLNTPDSGMMYPNGLKISLNDGWTYDDLGAGLRVGLQLCTVTKALPTVEGVMKRQTEAAADLGYSSYEELVGNAIAVVDVFISPDMFPGMISTLLRLRTAEGRWKFPNPDLGHTAGLLRVPNTVTNAALAEKVVNALNRSASEQW
jgi:hypothetical protein